MSIEQFIYRSTIEPLPLCRSVEIGSGARGDDTLASFIDAIAPEANVMAFGSTGGLHLKQGSQPAVAPIIRALPDGRPVWLFEYPTIAETGRSFVLVLVDNSQHGYPHQNPDTQNTKRHPASESGSKTRRADLPGGYPRWSRF